MELNKEYKLTTALLQFRHAYRSLVEASRALPDLDMTDSYPFYLLDFEEIAPAVLQWCTIHASKLMERLPERVTNPACLTCQHLGAGIAPSGLCKGNESCANYPVIPYMPQLVAPFLTSTGATIEGLSDNEIHLLYIRKVEEVYEERKGGAVSS